MTKSQKLIVDATAAGRRIEQQSTRTLIWFGRDDGVIVNEDRTITRLIPNSNRITDAQARHVLRIK
jgi:hypothetical protein